MSAAAIDHPTLVHPTDYAPAGRGAFAHAVRLALRGRYAFSLLNIATEALGPHHSGVREVIDLLARWKMLPPGPAGAECLERDLGFSVVGVAIPAGDARNGIIDYLDNCRCDLAVIATRRHRGLSRWLERSLADRTLARGATLALLIGENARAFVNPLTGDLKLQRILLAVDDRVDLEPALARLDEFIDSIGAPAEVRLLHVGASDAGLRLPRDGHKRQVMLRDGPVAETILDTARRVSADIIAMPTARKSGVVAALRGSVTAEVLDDGRWPVLSVPAA